LVPLIARQQRAYGAVELEATITKEGAVKDVRVLGGPPLLVTPAVDAIKRRRYQPAMLNGVPIEAKVPIRIVFEPPR
jgi:TonB family protein